MAAGSQPAAAAPRRQAVDPGRYWAGGAATALVAALIAVAGTVVLKALFGVPVVVPTGLGSWREASAWWYSFGAGIGGLAASGLMYGLLRFTPRPMRFFGWVVGLATLVTVTAPFGTNAPRGAELGTALLNLVLGAAIGSLVAGTARGAMRAAGRPHPLPPYRP